MHLHPRVGASNWTIGPQARTLSALPRIVVNRSAPSGQPGHAVGQVAGAAPLDESEQVTQPAQRPAVRAPAAASPAEGHLRKGVGDGREAIAARLSRSRTRIRRRDPAALRVTRRHEQRVAHRWLAASDGVS
jgi:hypothetical protein